ncbi:MAG TPA: double-strand break repair protein AddB [Hyphomicrobium sp.]|nr:double-strand break repair protein AddB [Hyphomicrobium sp.]
MTARIYTVPPGQAFLPALARAILNGDLPSPGGPRPDHLALPDITLLLPTRRATRAAQDAFLAASGARALLMPRIRPISEGEDDLTLLTSLAAPAALGPEALELPEAIKPLPRTLTLMQLIQRWREQLAEHQDAHITNTPAQAASLAIELANLMDEVERENVAFEKIHDLVPEMYSAHWQMTVDFLKIVSDFKAFGLTSEVETRNALILAEARRLETHPPTAPFIVAGVTGSIPATVALMRAVLALPNGAIVLPALDLGIDDQSWQAIRPDNDMDPPHPEHPQFGLRKLLDQLGVDRSSVQTLPGVKVSASTAARNAFISEAMRPSATTANWHLYTSSTPPTEIAEALAGISLIEAPSAQDEAEVVALILRESVETPGRTAALVSPDRLLARRVAIRLEAWGIRVDDSAGRPFAKTVPGTFLNLVAAAVVSDFAPADVMALLKHPLCRLGLKAFDVRRFGRALEIAAFRAPYLGRGIEGIAAALRKSESDRLEKKRRHSAADRLWDDDLIGAADLVTRLAAAVAPMAALYARNDKHPLSVFAAAHADTAERLAALPDDDPDQQPDANPVWQGDAGETANAFFLSLDDAALPQILISADDYADLYQSLLARENVRERTPVHPRVSIWGASEARLQQPDVLVLGSLNEGTWPKAAESGAWLNRPMRKSLGLPSPEEATGRDAHDFISLLGADRVYLTRAQKIKGVPTVPSRWLMRITALLDGLTLQSALASDEPWLAWARARDAIDEVLRDKVKIKIPAPTPPLAARPRRMSVTGVESWIANPYAVFARQILKLEPLPALGQAPDQSLRGAIVHDVLSRFATAHPASLPDNTRTILSDIAARLLADLTGHPRVAAFWMPRLERFLDWFAGSETARRSGVTRVIAETSGSLIIAAPGGPFTLTARADRIDDAAGGLVITDYKTGVIPSEANVLKGRSPQLPLEAAIAASAIGFPDLAGHSVQALKYIRASGGEPPGEEKFIKTDDVSALAATALQGLESLVALYDDEATPYRATRRPGFRYDYDDYAHLARVAEWSAHSDDEGGA